MKSSKEIIGRKIKILRVKKNLTLQELADMLGVDRQYMWRLENGKINMTLKYLDKVINKLNCPNEDFFDNNSKN